jgi:hypothetical protein
MYMRSVFILGLILLLLDSCQKVINVNLDSTAPQYVIVGKVTDQPGTCQVNITRSKDFSEDNQFPGVSGATVTIENNGVVTPLPETDSGVYSCSLIGQPGQTYALTVLLGGTTFTSSSTMPQPVGIDSLYVSPGRLTTKKYVTVVYKDPLGIANYYHFIQYVNGKKEPSVFVSDDEFTDGQTVKSQLDFNNDTNDPARDITSGDSVRLDMICNDAAVYKFWYSLHDGATGTGQSASPANPVTNISGGALGYFSAQTIRTRTIKAN